MSGIIPSVKNILLLLLTIGPVACAQQSKQQNDIKDALMVTPGVQQLIQTLEVAEKQQDSSGFNDFFAAWNKISKPNTHAFINQNDTTKAVFNIFKTFYQPLDLLKIGDWEWGNNLNAHCKYIVVNNKIYYSVLATDSLKDYNWQTSKKDSVEDFRPPVNMKSSIVLYLTKEYFEAINHFLGTESTARGEGNIMNPAMAAGKSEQRYKMLRPYIPILHGHWGGYWHLSTHPDVFNIILNKGMNKASIDFRVGYQGGEAVLERSGENWVVRESKATWIE
ncbi:MAG: hypothetical protein INR73_13395 [Williamsia sp.]|nr:hypothetical protein [Williamsia sp.]